ncbi:MAG TPA: glycoside hydrolase family 2 TIM barrel-domain containing protein [Candidatus Acidoferrum sp.]|nr:glycoside hydrolase family 2 TIM barrel-domain containing protein [Candidatus Acidoferrum sp.]
MLNSLPHGMLQEDVGGIWQPVTLTATAPVFVNDCFIEPDLHGAKIDLEIMNAGQKPTPLSVAYAITSYQGGDLLYSNLVSGEFLAVTGQTNHLVIQTPHLQPKLWSPQDPNLYNLDITLNEQGKEVDHYRERFGFRTFAVDGDRLLLNGHPFWLRGADPFPNSLCPNDALLAHCFMEIARAGNVVATRSHIVPFTSTWLDAADEVGMAVSFEGTWPWLMLAGRPPGDELIDDWRDEYISLIKEYRNHPSIILWTVNNEMKFERFDERDPRMLKKKWTILDDTIKAMREADPSRPIIADSSYVRKEALLGYRNLVEPDRLDDGDIDDVHSYYGWYEESFFHLYDGEFNEIKTASRPLISQEMSTGYPNNDDGHPARFYLFKHYTPQALVGEDAYENADPSIFLDRQAFMTKELAETLRRTSHASASGILFFSYFTWFQTPWQPDNIKPWHTYYALKTALQPVLVSAELYGRHFYSDSAIRERVCIVNDSEDYQKISDSRLVWEFRQGDKVLSQGNLKVPPVPYYENRWLNVTFETPRELPAPRIDGQLVLRLISHGKTLSQNSYDVVMASHAWAQRASDRSAKVFFWNLYGHRAFDPSDVRGKEVHSIQSLDPSDVLVVGGPEGKNLDKQEKSELMDFISRGGRVLMLHLGGQLAELFPDAIQGFKTKEGEIVTMHVPESPVFSGIEPLDLAWFGSEGRRLPVACTGVYQIATKSGVVALADQCDIHGYLKGPSDIEKYSGTPLVELQVGSGTVIASELNLEAGSSDPIAERMLSNLIQYLTSEGQQQTDDAKTAPQHRL